MIMKLLLLLIISFPCLTAEESPPDEYMVKQPNCPYRCGNVSIPFPFGIGKSCYLNEWYSVNCSTNVSSGAAKLFLNHTELNLELLNISLEYQRVTINSPIASYYQWQGGSTSSLQKSIDLGQSPFLFSRAANIFVVLGCGHAHLMEHGEIWAGCTSSCNRNYTAQGCYGINCCETTISSRKSYYLNNYNVSFNPLDDTTGEKNTSTHALLVDSDWFSGNFTKPEDVVGVGHAPVSLFWNIIKHSDLDKPNSDCEEYTYNSSSGESYTGYSCSCGWSYEGNPYLTDGCHVVKGCTNCLGTCDYRYNSISNDGEYYCNMKKRRKALILGLSIGGGSLLLLLLGSIGLYNEVKKKKAIRLKRQFFKQNGGLLLEQQIFSDKVAVEKTKIFTFNELEKATNNFNLNQIIGQGGQGTVYKGMLTDGRIVAVKKSMIVDESQIEHFINEIVILSQINHRNIVRLLGCCLETKVPLLVYEFISNGTLFQLIHNQDTNVLLSWEMRLQIAIEVARALAYLHSACSIPIYHRDIKSTNILLDDKCSAKVSDFGISRSISIDQTHLTTLVQGTLGYLDPQYFYSSQFTEKSDVYSFGVVLVELLTRQKAICSTRPQEEKNLATHFLFALEESHLFDILDAQVVKEGGKKDIMAVAYLAYQCLYFNGRKRPTMKEVTTELEHIRASLPHLKVEQNFEEKACNVMEITGPLDSASSPRRSYLNCSKASSSHEQPLLFNTL